MFWRWLRSHILDVFNVLIAVAALAISFGGLLIARDSNDIKEAVRNISDLATQTKRQADNSDSQVRTLASQFAEMQRQTNALEASAKAAEGQLNETRIEQQPVISVLPPRLVRTTDLFTSWEITIEAQNSGSIPPQRAESVFHSTPVPAGPITGVGINYPQLPDDPVKLFDSQLAKLFTKQSGKAFGAHVPELIGRESIDESRLVAKVSLPNGDFTFKFGAFFLYGAIRYSDRIHPRPHLVKFCYVVQAEGFRSNGTDIRPMTQATECRHWNCSDEQCKADEIAFSNELKAGTVKVVPAVGAR